jgi:hypothetical protein
MAERAATYRGEVAPGRQFVKRASIYLSGRQTGGVGVGHAPLGAHFWVSRRSARDLSSALRAPPLLHVARAGCPARTRRAKRNHRHHWRRRHHIARLVMFLVLCVCVGEKAKTKAEAKEKGAGASMAKAARWRQPFRGRLGVDTQQKNGRREIKTTVDGKISYLAGESI